MSFEVALLSFVISFVSSNLALLLWIHFDLEGRWEQRRLEHGAKLDARARARAAKPRTPR